MPIEKFEHNNIENQEEKIEESLNNSPTSSDLKQKIYSIEEELNKWKELSEKLGVEKDNPQIEKEYKDLGGEWLGKKYPDLKKSEHVILSHEYAEEQERNRMDTWLKNAESFHERHRDKESMEAINNAFHKEYVIKPEDVPESYFEFQKRLAREQGHGDIEITKELRSQAIETIINDQKATLDNWVNYVLSEDADAYPMWAKYWALRSMTKLSGYDKEKKTFGTRRKDTVSPFPDLNREALSFVVDAIVKKSKKENITVADNNSEFIKLLESENFGKLYAYAIEKVTPTEESELIKTKGEWIKYDQGVNHMILVESLQGHGTGWCTAGETTAKAQLKSGDFYVYYSYDKEGNPTIPRAAIRMNGKNQIGEVRGVAPDQNLDPYIGNIVNDKLKEFPDHEKYEKKTQDMKTLTVIEKKYRNDEELTKEDLRFLYEIDSKIEGFGYQKDPRINEIIQGRDIKKDISLITGFSKEEISITQEEALRGGIKFHKGDLDLSSLKSAEGLKFPESIGGYLNLRHLKSAEGLKLPESIGGSLYLPDLELAEGLKLPESIGEDINLSNLKSAEGLKFPESIGGCLDLHNLKSAEGLKLPESIGGYLDLYNIESAEGLKLPESIGGYLDLHNLKSAEGLKLPESIGEDINLSNLKSAEGLKLPESIGGSLYLRHLKSAEGLKLPESIGGNLDLRHLESAEGLKLPESIRGYLNLGILKSAKGLKLPESIGGDLNLSSLESAEGLKLPESIGGDLNLYSLKSTEGLKLPESIGGSLSLGDISSNELEKLIEKYPNIEIL